MTVEEKRDAVLEYCTKKDCSTNPCVLERDDWKNALKGATGRRCLNIARASEEELDRALALINEQTNAKFIGCEYCKYVDRGEAEPPCLFCKHNKEFDSWEYMTAPVLYEPSTGEVLPVRQAEGLKSTAAVIQLEVGDGSVMQVANAICKYYVQCSETEKGLIDLDELTEHIDAYVRAERKALEYKKLTEEG